MFMISDFFRDKCLMFVDEIAIFSVLNFDVVKYLFLQRSAAIFALVDRQLNNQEESQRTVFASTSALRSRFGHWSQIW